MKMKFLFVLSLVFVMSSFAFAQSPAGKWSGEMPGGRGGAGTPVVFEFTVAGTTLNGTITVGAGMPTPITAGTIAGDTITFQAPAGGGGGGGRGAGGGAPGGGAPPAAGGAPPAGGGAPPAAAGAPPAGAGGGAGGRGGGGGGLATFTGKVTAAEIAFSRVGGGGGGGGRGGAPGGAPGGGAPGGGAPPAAGGAPPAAGAAPAAPGAAPAAPAPVTFTVKKAS